MEGSPALPRFHRCTTFLLLFPFALPIIRRNYATTEILGRARAFTLFQRVTACMKLARLDANDAIPSDSSLLQHGVGHCD